MSPEEELASLRADVAELEAAFDWLFTTGGGALYIAPIVGSGKLSLMLAIHQKQSVRSGWTDQEQAPGESWLATLLDMLHAEQRRHATLKPIRDRAARSE